MITKLFTNKGRFIKSFLFMTAIVFFAVGPVIQKTAEATAINELFPNAQELNGAGIITTNVYIEETPNTKTGDSVTVNVTLVGSPDAVKPTEKTKNSKVDSGDDIGAWDAIFDSDNFEQDDSGVFLRISKKDPVKNTYTPIQYNTKLPIVENANHSTSKISGSVKNISGLFFTNNDYFFNKDMKLAVNVPIYNLEISTTYKFEVFILENGLTFGYDTFNVEPVLEITTGSNASGGAQLSGGAINPKDITKEFNKEIIKPSGNVNDICSSVKQAEGTVSIDNFYCQMIKVIVEIITFIPNAIAAITGSLADYVMNISIGHGTYQLFQDTMFKGWKVIRDISNLIIIFSLFIAAFTLILGWGNDDGPEMVRSKIGDPKKIVARAIMVAIFINFSFFFCRVLIDAGNVSGRFIYNQIGTTGDLGGGSKLIEGFVNSQSSDVKNISLAMLSQVQPQKLLIDGPGANTEELGLGLTHAYLVTGFLVLIFDVILIYIFLIMLFLFMGRIVFLSLSTILSPLAFASAIIPGLAKQKYIGFEDWLKNMVGNAFVGTVFFFFIYLSILFSNIDITPLGTGQYTGFIGLVVGMLFKVSLIFGVLFFGKKIAVDIAGVVGEMAVNLAGKVAGVASGAAIGGTAMLARQTVGALGAGVANSDWAKKMIGSDSGFISGIGRGLKFGGGKLGASSFDVRNSGMAMGGLNTAMNKLSGGTMPTAKDMMGDSMKNEGGFNKERRNLSVMGLLDGSVAKNAKDKYGDFLRTKAMASEQARIDALKLGPDHPLTIAQERAEADKKRQEEIFNNSAAGQKAEANKEAIVKAQADLKEANEAPLLKEMQEVNKSIQETNKSITANDKALSNHDKTVGDIERNKKDAEKQVDDLTSKLAAGITKNVSVLDDKGRPKVDNWGTKIMKEEKDTEAEAAMALEIETQKERAKKHEQEIKDAEEKADDKTKKLIDDRKKLQDKKSALADRKDAIESDPDWYYIETDKDGKEIMKGQSGKKKQLEKELKEKQEKDRTYRNDKEYQEARKATIGKAEDNLKTAKDAVKDAQKGYYKEALDNMGDNTTSNIASRFAEVVTGGTIGSGSGSLNSESRQAKRAQLQRALRNSPSVNPKKDEPKNSGDDKKGDKPKDGDKK